MENPLKTNECPSQEMLSAYFDKESKQYEHIEKHLKTCQTCKSYIDSLTRIDYLIKHAVSQECGSDEEISKRILARVKSSVKNEKREKKYRFFLSPVQWRAASLVFIAGVLGYFLWDEYKASEQLPEIPLRIESSASVPASLTGTPVNPIQISDMQNVKFSSEQTVPLRTDNSFCTIKDEVRHVWGMEKSTESKLRSIMKKNNIPASELKTSDTGLTFTFKGNKLQIVNFVNDCAKSGFRLYSPDQPQPEQKCFTGSANDQITYHCSFTFSK